MRNAVRVALLAMLLMALPLRGYAGVLMALCEGHHGGSAAAQAHEHGGDHHPGAMGDGADDPSQVASMCSVCASCSAGAGLAPQLVQGIVYQAPGTNRIPFAELQVSGFVPEHLDRPPLPL